MRDPARWYWWRDCRLVFINHWTALINRDGRPDHKGRTFRCAECGARF